MVCRVSFVHCKGCRMPVEARIVHFDHCKACRKYVDVQRVQFDHREVGRPVEFWRVRFYNRKACKMLIGVLHKFEDSI